MGRNFIWGILMFVLNMFIVYQNYTKNFTIPNNFFIEANEMITFIIGVLYANQYRKFDFKHIWGIIVNSLVFSVLITITFGIYGSPVTILFSSLVFVFAFIGSFVGYGLFYFFFCPKRHKKKSFLSKVMSIIFRKKKVKEI